MKILIDSNAGITMFLLGIALAGGDAKKVAKEMINEVKIDTHK